MSDTLPLIMTTQGAQPTPPATILAALIAAVTADVPGYTASLPGSLIEDISSTDVAAIALCDTARVELVNSLTPYGANGFILNQLGEIYGVHLGAATTTSAYITVFGDAGFVIPVGFTVSDGTYQYVAQDGGVIQSDGASDQLYVVSSTLGSWAVPANTITQIVSSVPAGYGLTVTNTAAGIPGTTAQTIDQYRSLVLQAGKAVATSMQSLVKTALNNVAGTQQRLISVQQASLAGWEIIVGGGDPYAVAAAILASVADISMLVGSVINSSRNRTVSLVNPPDTYSVTFVVPPQQTVGLSVLWGTSSLNLVSNNAVASLASPALVSYINSIVVGKLINLLELQSVFQIAVSPLIPTPLLTRLVISVTIDGSPAYPVTGTGIIEGDPESFFFTSQININIAQG